MFGEKELAPSPNYSPLDQCPASLQLSLPCPSLGCRNRGPETSDDRNQWTKRRAQISEVQPDVLLLPQGRVQREGTPECLGWMSTLHLDTAPRDVSRIPPAAAPRPAEGSSHLRLPNLIDLPLPGPPFPLHLFTASPLPWPTRNRNPIGDLELKGGSFSYYSCQT